ncbi:uncharacterized protein LAESUDRAFT_712029 [Laetiporus sulphureus 93-53]|uniref:SAP domain-containing protein n=1 Tax=Laetiporus sulphureus 93-53 TaxID=1314785 RepID=A0A165FW57_9APHY|nr:uncharacterized protein LAESUDRAFT_712029 [Laetiporus sulphureus 93-53]KZT09489.1 hypothetical protein LAESUDRAFT_712029 [Laetiporus sulphureus 93-53]
MLRSALRIQLRVSHVTCSRSLVSTVLLTKTWEDMTVTDLKNEARKRGLQPNAKRATLINRLREDDEKRAMSLARPVFPQVPQPVRHASTEVPGVPSTSEPLPSKTFPKEFMDVKLPDLSQPAPEPPIQIPFLPDMWDSSRIKAESAPKEPTVDMSAPKMVAVAGSATHIGGGPTYSLSNAESEQETPKPSVNAGPSGIWGDIAEDFYLPTLLKPLSSAKEATFDIAELTETSGAQQKNYSRALGKDEVKGVWALLGLLAGSWIIAGFFAPSSVFAEHVTEAVEEDAAGH